MTWINMKLILIKYIRYVKRGCYEVVHRVSKFL